MGFVKSLFFFFGQKKFFFFLGRWVMGFGCFIDGVVGFGLVWFAWLNWEYELNFMIWLLVNGLVGIWMLILIRKDSRCLFFVFSFENFMKTENSMPTIVRCLNSDHKWIMNTVNCFWHESLTIWHDVYVYVFVVISGGSTTLAYRLKLSSSWVLFGLVVEKKFRVQNEKYIGVYLYFFSLGVQLKPRKRVSSATGSNPCIYLVFGCLLSWNKQAEGVSKCLICVSLCVTDMCGYIRWLQFFQTITIQCLFVSVDVSCVWICVGTSWCHGQCFENWIKYWTGDISG